jgi:single-stranded-DNA-specific exonuclease
MRNRICDQALAKNRNQNIDDLVPYLDLVATAVLLILFPDGQNRTGAFWLASY